MTRRERIEAKLAKRREWAESRSAKSEAAFNRAHDLVKDIPMGQPILVGHYSERRHRRIIERSHAASFAGVDHMKMAERHAARADGLEMQLDAIFSDDSDALERLAEKVEELEAKRAQRVAENKAARKEGRPAPWPSYSLSNLSGNLRRYRLRIEDMKRRAKRAAQAEAAPGGVLIVGEDYCNVTFAEKPEREIINALKAAGFGWCGGCWGGYRSKLPAAVAAMAEGEVGLHEPEHNWD